MNQEIETIMRGAEGRYLTNDEGRKVLDVARGYEKRLLALRTLEQKEAEIVRTTIERVFQKYPKFHQERPMAYEKAERDVSLVVRYCGLAMVNHDPEFLREKLLYWMRTIMTAMEFGPVLKYTYEQLQENVARALPPAEAEEMAPYTRACVEILAS